MCSQASHSTIKCLWSDKSGNIVSQDFTVKGNSLLHSLMTGSYSGNGAITWTAGDIWEKQGTKRSQ